MATVVLQAAGVALGGMMGPVGAVLGRAFGAVVGAGLDQALFAAPAEPAGRLSTARIAGPEEGAAIPRVYGTARIGGTLIWATRFTEDVTQDRTGAKGAQRSGSYVYSANLALGLCEGPIAGVRRVWADGRELSLENIEMRVHAGSATQQPDPLIAAKQGAGHAPAYRGLAYVVFENLPLGDFGNRIPLLQFEVMRPVGALERQVRAVNLIPGATEHGYDPAVVSERTGVGEAAYLNRHTLSGASDWETSLDELQALCPGLKHVALTSAWFGDDLDAARCRILPGVETRARDGESTVWAVSGLTRASAHQISDSGSGIAYGGTPSDAGMVRAIRDLRRRGLKVTLYPFLLMDIPPGNTLADPQGAARQPPYPWRGRITLRPAAGLAGTPDGTAAARVAVEHFAGRAVASDFRIDGDAVVYDGAETGFRRMILHHAWLAKLSGGVDAFLLGSELRGLTTIRDHAGRFPFVEMLVSLAAEVRQVLGPQVKITYGADWSEYSGYQPPGQPGDMIFHLDPLWASPDIDAVGIDNYLPLADFRDEDLAAASPDGFRHQADPAGLERGITGGERQDWYYASDADRAARRRSPIADGLAGKPWIYAPKDIESWWSNRHVNRIGGRETAATAWLPRMKPVWFTELGCPAIDRGANQPNVFLDPKSAESDPPHFSREMRSDAAQRRFLEAHHRHWQGAAAPDGMVDPERVYLWCWDARPFPAFPHGGAWADGPNWQTGHWLNGRLGAGTLADVIAAILRDHGFEDFDVSGVQGDLIGYVKGEAVPARQLLEPLLAAFRIDVAEDGAVLRFTSRGEASADAPALAELSEAEGEPGISETRAEESRQPGQVLIGFCDPANGHEPARARSLRLEPAGERVHELSLPAVMDAGLAGIAATGLLRDLRAGRRGLRFRLPPTRLDLMPGDRFTLEQGPPGRFRITRIDDGADRLVEAEELAPQGAPAFRPLPVPQRKPATLPSAAFAPEIMVLDLPRIDDGADGSFLRVAALSRPWRGLMLSTQRPGEAQVERTVLDRPARMGQLAEPLAATAVFGRFDPRRRLVVDLFFGAAASVPRDAVLAGENRAVISGPQGPEVIGWQAAEEIAPGRFLLSHLLNGLAGTEGAAGLEAAAGTRLVLLDGGVKPLGLSAAETGRSHALYVRQAGAAGGSAGPFAVASGLRAETPLAPVQLRAVRQADGSIRISWCRRSRIDADGWDATEVPLDEPFERYQLEVLDAAGTVLRRVEVSTPAFLYTAAMERADRGGPQRRIALQVRQAGRRVALGAPLRAELPV